MLALPARDGGCTTPHPTLDPICIHTLLTTTHPACNDTLLQRHPAHAEDLAMAADDTIHDPSPYDLAIIGGGTAALVASVGAAGVGARVVLIEADRTGGDCLWTGCVPSKALLHAGQRAHDMRTGGPGVAGVEPEVDFRAVMDHIRSTQAAIEPHDSPERLEREGVEVVHGYGRFVGDGRIEVELHGGGTREIAYLTAMVATGSQPVLPPVPGLDEVGALTNETVWDLEELPARLLVLGGGPIGSELGQAFSRLGSQVTLVEMADRLLIKEEPEASEVVGRRLAAEGIDVRTSTKAVGARRDGDEVVLTVEASDGSTSELRADAVLAAAGRRPSTDGIGLETVGVEVDGRGAMVVDHTLRSANPRVFGAGDVVGMLPFTHVAGHHGGLVVTNALFGLRRKVEPNAVPWATFTDPEVGRVGFTEAEARERHGNDVEVTRIGHDKLDRAIAVGDPDGFTKLVLVGSKVAGATIVGPVAGEATAEVVQVMRSGGSVSDLGQAIHAYPTFGESVQKAANEKLRETYLSDRTRKVTGPALKVMRRLRD